MDLKQQVEHIIKRRPKAVADMSAHILAAIKERADFEHKLKPNGSHVELRKVFRDFYGIDGNKTVSAFFIAVDADPQLLFNRQRKDFTRANLKGFHKIRKLINLVMGTGDVDTVTKALFASTIIAALKGVNWVASPEQELILSPEAVLSLPADIREAIYSFQHKHSTVEGDARPQASQFRTTFENLNCFVSTRDEFDNVAYTKGVTVLLNSPIVSFLKDKWQLDRFNTKGN